jgi:hypothetical protein
MAKYTVDRQRGAGTHQYNLHVTIRDTDKFG